MVMAPTTYPRTAEPGPVILAARLRTMPLPRIRALADHAFRVWARQRVTGHPAEPVTFAIVKAATEAERYAVAMRDYQEDQRETRGLLPGECA